MTFVFRDCKSLRRDTGAVSSADISGILAGLTLTAVCSHFTVSSAWLAFFIAYISILINVAGDRSSLCNHQFAKKKKKLEKRLNCKPLIFHAVLPGSSLKVCTVLMLRLNSFMISVS